MTSNQLAYKERVKRLYPIGAAFDRLTVIGWERQSNGTWCVMCQCSCGNNYRAKHPCHLGRLVTSCGCKNRELSRARRLGKPPNNRLPAGESYVRLMFRTYKLHAQRRSLIFKITLDEFRRLVSGNCSYCGTKPKPAPHVGRYHGAAAINGVDRINSKNGYIIENCTSCCKQCNRAKSNLSLAEFKTWVKRVAKHISS